MAGFGEPACDISAHASEADNSKLHRSSPRVIRARGPIGGRFLTEAHPKPPVRQLKRCQRFRRRGRRRGANRLPGARGS